MFPEESFSLWSKVSKKGEIKTMKLKVNTYDRCLDLKLLACNEKQKRKENGLKKYAKVVNTLHGACVGAP